MKVASGPRGRLSTIAIIPARLGASRLPRKPLRHLAGQPLILRVLARVIELGVAQRVVVATDSPEVLECVTSAGGKAVMTSDQHSSGTDRVAEVAARSEYSDCDAIVNVQGDEPFVTGEVIAGALRQVTHLGYELGTAAARADSSILANPDIVKVVTTDDGAALYFSRAPIPYLRDLSDATDRETRVLHHVGIYAYTPASLARWVALPQHPLERVERLEQLRPLAAGMTIGIEILSEAQRAGIDTEQDLERANREWSHTNNMTQR